MRDLGRLADTTFDVLVVGAGIYGAAVAWDAALRGFSVALVDQSDFGSGTSANSLKTVHGGLRSLQRGAVGDLRRFVRERRALLRLAPHLVVPLTFVVPTSRHPVRNRLVMRIALALNDLIAADRNDGLLPSHRLHGGRLLSRADTLSLAPDLDPAHVTGGASWCDAQMVNSERLVWAFVASAARAGAVTCNYVAVEGLTRQGTLVTGATVREVFTGARFGVRARVTVNAAGAWAARLSAAATGRAEAELLPAVSRAMNVVTDRPGTGPAVGGLSLGRFFFRVPWRGRTMYGTSHDPYSGAPGEARPAWQDVEGLLADLTRAFPRAPLRREEIRLVHWGLLPSVPGSGPHVDLVKESLLRDHRKDGIDGLVTLIGVRYTTARETAEHAVDLAASMLGRRGAPSRAAAVRLVGADFEDLEALRAETATSLPGLPAATIDRLVRSYGSQVGEVIALAQTEPGLACPLGAPDAITGAEVVFAARRELALTLADVLLRRTEAGTAGWPGADTVDAAADLLARELGWDQRRVAAEKAAVTAHYRLRDEA